MFEGVESADKDPRQSLHVDDVATPELAPDEAVRGRDGQLHQLQHGVDLDLRAAADLRLPRPPRQGERLGRPPRPAVPRGRLRRLGRRAASRARRCATGSRATGSPSTATTSTTRTPVAHDDSMLGANQRIWGFETNFGGLADLTVVKANQLMPKPAHLTWEEAAVNALCNSTSYRMLVQPQRGADDARATRSWSGARPAASAATPCQYVLNGGGTPVGVVSSADKVDLLHELGVEARHRPQGRRLPVLGRRAHPGRDGVAPPRQGHPGPDRPRPRHRLRAPRSPDLRRLGVRRPPGAARSSPAPPPPAT